MKTNATDEKLKRFFQEMRREDAVGVPSFDRMAQPAMRAPHAPATATAVARWAAATALIVLGMGVMVMHKGSPQPSTELRQERWVSFADWQASTDNLLTLPDERTDGTFATATDEWLDMNPT